MKRRRWSAQESARMVELYHDHWTLVDIAAELGRTLSSVRTRVETLHLRRERCNRWTDDDVQQLIALRGAGLPFEEVAELLGRSVSGCKHKHSTLTRPKLAQTVGAPVAFMLQPHPKIDPKRELTFEEKLELVRTGKARISEKISFNRQPDVVGWSGSQLA